MTSFENLNSWDQTESFYCYKDQIWEPTSHPGAYISIPLKWSQYKTKLKLNIPHEKFKNFFTLLFLCMNKIIRRKKLILMIKIQKKNFQFGLIVAKRSKGNEEKQYCSEKFHNKRTGKAQHNEKKSHLILVYCRILLFSPAFSFWFFFIYWMYVSLPIYFVSWENEQMITRIWNNRLWFRL